ncbi:alkaline phosphatase family protein [Halococcus sediminicola]|uniref:hypothetical protein n=1 Tax=Halococcus sediminicola TaxID=1264579 RepID=UPI00192A1378|nr:hypothetical protein [Halococcus sediminicola]
MFREIASPELKGTTKKEISRGSATPEFLAANFDGNDVSDTVYVTANPQLERNADHVNANFHATEQVWLDEGWDEKWGTVLPETITEHAKEAIVSYPNKRLIVHYMQPHYPFITDSTTEDKEFLNQASPQGKHIWLRYETGDSTTSIEVTKAAYYDNLRRTLPHIQKLVDALDGRTVITSDHGNMLGERSTPIPIKQWGHPSRTYTPELIEIPWHVIDDDEERKIVAEDETNNETDVEQSVVEDRLSQLGYLEE